ncbi:hypothetical protein NDU88_007396 [Pleurodeles waltl]|uniref:Uncharacterized protein n=1 Tax=Pleurodeles waltl TaxID=8319 RepID=A0AAV7TZW5_PLEWA|nr:hypothetical protein NDU88_007396 [Pleurodeles waltl]
MQSVPGGCCALRGLWKGRTWENRLSGPTNRGRTPTLALLCRQDLLNEPIATHLVGSEPGLLKASWEEHPCKSRAWAAWCLWGHPRLADPPADLLGHVPWSGVLMAAATRRNSEC